MKKEQKNFILLLDGMTRAGKSTLSAIIKKEIPQVVILGLDKIKFFISDFKRSNEDNQIVRNVIFSMSKEYLNQNISVIIDNSFKNDGLEIQKYEKYTKENNILLKKVQIYVNPEIAIERIMDR